MTVDKPFITVFASLVLGVLTMLGYTTHDLTSDQIGQWINAILGGFIAIIGIVSYFAHHTEVQKAKIAQNATPASAQPVQQTVTVTPNPTTSQTTS